VDDARARCYLRAYSGVAVALVPPVVPDARLRSGGLALSENDRLPVSPHCHPALEIRQGKRDDVAIAPAPVDVSGMTPETTVQDETANQSHDSAGDGVQGDHADK
jgi:hypothetical protein